MTERVDGSAAPHGDGWADVRSRMGAVLDRIEAEHQVRVVFAVESGSRAWGFPSPDSDYDCRFVFVRRRERYLTLWPPRDVIELPLDGELDVNGWDLGKAIRLLCKGNAVILEWLASPLVYRDETGWRERLAELARRVVDRDAVGRHYLHLGYEQLRRHLQDEAVLQKKVFYALRPSVAARWMRRHPHVVSPPMHLPTLMAGADLPKDVAAFTTDLIARKAVTRELGTAEIPGFVRGFIETELDAARAAFGRDHEATSPARRAIADAAFRDALDELG